MNTRNHHNKYYKKGERFIGLAQMDLALEQFQRGVEEFSVSKHKNNKRMQYDYYINFSQCYYHKGNLQLALENANKAYALSPIGFYIFELLFNIHISMDNNLEARKIFDNRASFLLPSTFLANFYKKVLDLYLKRIILINFDEKLKPTDTQTILQEITTFAVRHGEPNAQSHYENCGTLHHFEKDEYAEAITYAIKQSRSDNLNLKVAGLYNAGFAYLKKKSSPKVKEVEIKLAISFFKKVIEIYQVSQDDLLLRNVRLAAHSLSKIFDGDNDSGVFNVEDDGSKFWNANESVKYLKYSAELQHTESCHDLGYKYEQGEDVEQDLDLAIKYYRQASDAGFHNSQLNLGLIKFNSLLPHERDECINFLKKAFESSDLNIKKIAASCLGIYYLQICVTYHSEDKPIPSEYSAFAYSYLNIAMKYNASGASYNLGLIVFYEIGYPKNLLAALNFFQHALAEGAKEAIPKIEAVYYALISEENDKPLRAKYVSDLLAFGKAHNLVINLNDLEIINRSINKINSKIFQDIYHHAENNELNEIDRIGKLLDTNLDDLSSNNLSMLVNKLGNLIDRNKGAIDFYKNHYARIIKIIVKVATYLLSDPTRFETVHLSFLAVGLSKLYLKNDSIGYRMTMRVLFSRIVTKMNEMDMSSLINIIVSVTRLDSNLEIYKAVLSIIEYVFKKYESLNNSQLIDLLNTIVVLNLEIMPSIDPVNPEMLVRSCLKIATEELHHVEASKLYLAFKYLSNTEKWDTFFAPKLLDKLKACVLLGSANNSRSKHKTAFQKDVIRCLSHVINTNNIKEEKMINVYPVDALVRLSETTAVILQVDGPTHFLHGEDDRDPVVVPRTLFRDQYLQNYFSTMTVNYKQWDGLKTDVQKVSFLKVLIASVALKSDLTKRRFDRNSLFVSTRNGIRKGKDLPSGALSGEYYAGSPRSFRN